MKLLLVIFISWACLEANCQSLYDSLKETYSDPVVFHKRGDYKKKGGITVYLEEELKNINDTEVRQIAICAMVSNLYGFGWMDNEYLFSKLQNVIKEPASEKVKSIAYDVHKEITRSLIGIRIREINLPDAGGDSIQLSSLFGKFNYIIIDLWATWCKPCIGEMKKFNDLRKEYNIEFYSISFDNKTRKFTRFVEKNDDYTWPIVFAGRNSPLWEDYFRVRFLPTYYIIDQNGIVV